MVSLVNRGSMLEDLAVIGGLIALQFLYAGYSILLGYLMSRGLDPLAVVVFSTFATFIIVSPAAVYLERSKWPRELGLELIIKLVLISFTGIVLFQSFLLKGIKLTSPALATAMPNLAPGLIFVIAWALRLEKVDLSCVYSKVKIVGTLVCVVGAVTMSLMHSTASTEESPIVAPVTHMIFDKQKIIGCAYLLGAVFAMSGNVVLQASTLQEFPAPLSLCAVTSLIGVALSAIVQLFQEHSFEVGVSVGGLLAFSFLGGAMMGAVTSFNAWAMKKRGPVLVSIFSPVGTVISAVLSAVTLGDTINLGSIGGMFLMFTGLYFVLWAKGKEGLPDKDGGEDLESEVDPKKKPLLS